MEVRPPTKEEKKDALTWPIWEKGISQFNWHYIDKETCYIVEGKASVTSEDDQAVSFAAGDLVIFEAGLKCVWNIEQPIKKHYKFN